MRQVTSLDRRFEDVYKRQLLSILGLLYALISKFAGLAVAGWTAIVCSIWLLGGVQLLCLGVLGEYIGKIYSEVKARPRYIIEEELKR